MRKMFKDVTKIKDVTQDTMSSSEKNPKSQFLQTSSVNNIRNSGENVNKKFSERDLAAGKTRHIRSYMKRALMLSRTMWCGLCRIQR